MRVKVAHVSLQFKDSDRQHTHDVEKIFDRAVSQKLAWVMGTEAGAGAGNTGEELLRIGRNHGYKVWCPSEQAEGLGRATDCWIAVRKDLVVGDWKPGYLPAIPGSGALYRAQGLDEDLFPRWGPKGLVTVSFKSLPQLGEISLGAAHYLTQARSPKAPPVHGVDHWEWNEKLAGVIGDWAKEVGKGSALAFYSGDQNMADSRNNEPQGDTFFGEPFTSLADELEKWQHTGHGPIDVTASYNKDGRVTGQKFNVLDDKEFFLHGDHFFLEGAFDVEPLKS